VFHGLHDKARAHVKEIGLDQLLVERVITGHIRHHRFHQIVDIAAQSMYLENARQLFNDALELAGPGRVVLIGFDGDKHRETQSQLALREQRNRPLDHAGLREARYAAATGRS